jgi:pimeloyl-ACP methyl ester carboxylesterase
MNNLRTYGKPPYRVAVIHGGPSAPGEMAAVARELSLHCGVLEPLQTAPSVNGQILELQRILVRAGGLPVTLIGYSWGAMLGFIFAARNPALVKKLILVSSGVFTEEYAVSIMNTRLSRLTERERTTLIALLKELDDPMTKGKDVIFKRCGYIIEKADSYDSLPHKSEVTGYQYDIYERVWDEIQELRKKGNLIAYGSKIQCPVVAIHGDYDPHPADGIRIPLSTVVNNFRFLLLENCGHRPWTERSAKNTFYDVLNKELK